MAIRRQPFPPLGRTVTPLEWVIVLGLWLAIELTSAVPLAKELQARGVPVSIHDLQIAQLIDWALWAGLLPFVWRTCDRFPLRRGVWHRHLPVWIAGGFGFGFVHALISLPVIHLAARMLAVAPAALSIPELRLWDLTLDDANNSTLAALGYFALQWVRRNRNERTRADEAERSLREARLHALGLELQPHFLFNTLNGIAALVRSDPPGAERMLVQLSDLLRLTLDGSHAAELPLGEELRRLDLYLALQQRRHGARLTIHSAVPDTLARARVPAMLLQPLAENALTHGIGGRAGPGTLTLTGRRDGEWLTLLVEDDGIGVPAGGPAREGIGLSNTRSRLAVLYPGQHEFRIEPRDGGGTRVVVRLPYSEAEAR